ncbi:MAG: hypothetical protein LBJ36_11445, partial [Synergistaceae bacterium]|nr:hypothetical protein [Synergistaceae bacterium]
YQELDGADAACKEETLRMLPLDYQVYNLNWDGSSFNVICEFTFDSETRGHGYFYQAEIPTSEASHGEKEKEKEESTLNGAICGDEKEKEKSTMKCAICEDEIKGRGKKLADGNTVCKDCYESSAVIVTCDDCGKEVLATSAVKECGFLYCRDCHAKSIQEEHEWPSWVAWQEWCEADGETPNFEKGRSKKRGRPGGRQPLRLPPPQEARHDNQGSDEEDRGTGGGTEAGERSQRSASGHREKVHRGKSEAPIRTRLGD